MDRDVQDLPFRFLKHNIRERFGNAREAAHGIRDHSVEVVRS